MRRLYVVRHRCVGGTHRTAVYRLQGRTNNGRAHDKVKSSVGGNSTSPRAPDLAASTNRRPQHLDILQHGSSRTRRDNLQTETRRGRRAPSLPHTTKFRAPRRRRTVVKYLLLSRNEPPAAGSAPRAQNAGDNGGTAACLHYQTKTSH
ncbi:hypothetical protein BD310DRAFT_937019 [Dichomitus squalens]|uniref:Uncharacterized protein n=1 Tax=Dichomitus squalens TaxID=114155 RepID=A0A4Q9PIR4_9APHY|nr:hypothetical protein BD310DRAFT_937019 [Dichomitus squalens]